MGKFFKWVFYAFAGLFLIGLLVPKQETGGVASYVATSEPAKPPADPIKMTVAEIVQAVENNELRIREQAKAAGGIAFTGRVVGVEEGMLGSGVVVKIRSTNQFMPMHAYMQSSERRRAVDLNSGEQVSLVCQRPTKMMGAVLYECLFR
jgi:hypothetical protein